MVDETFIDDDNDDDENGPGAANPRCRIPPESPRRIS